MLSSETIVPLVLFLPIAPKRVCVETFHPSFCAYMKLCFKSNRSYQYTGGSANNIIIFDSPGSGGKTSTTKGTTLAPHASAGEYTQMEKQHNLDDLFPL